MFPSNYKARITFLDGKKVGLDFHKPKPTQKKKNFIHYTYKGNKTKSDPTFTS